MPRILSILDRVLNQGIVVLTVFFLGALCFSLQQLSTMPFIEEIECAEGGTTRFPFTKELCLQHLFMFRGSEADIETLFCHLIYSYVTCPLMNSSFHPPVSDGA